MITKHEQGENSGIFGLRKSGKTSILYAISRALNKKKNTDAIIIDCQSLYQLRWNMALYKIIEKINNNLHLNVKDIDIKNYNPEIATISFSKDLNKIFNKNKSQSILLIFDEVEHLTYGISANIEWREGKDYLYFWHAIRAGFQEEYKPYTFILSGTNPRCVELISIDGTDNPLFLQIEPLYIDNFSINDTKEMVSTLGKYMGPPSVRIVVTPT